MIWCAALLTLLAASASGRAINISNTWILPEEGFPVFYRYFRDRISWYEADAVCQFHHANLVTVDTTAQYDAVRAYLKELDITNNVWLGLIRSNADGDFTWTDYRGLSGEGYWSSPPDSTLAPLCAAADPVSDYRWTARGCGGPDVASFICELPVPQWALGAGGCMVRALPMLTAVYLPESAAVQLTTDCGLAGVKKVLCTGDKKHTNILKDLSCGEVEEPDTQTSAVNSDPFTDLPTTEDVIQDQTTESYSAIVTEVETNSDNIQVSEHVTVNIKGNHDSVVAEVTTKDPSENTNIDIRNKNKALHELEDTRLNSIASMKGIEMDIELNNNLQSNEIPKIVHEDDLQSNLLHDDLEDDIHLKSKILHDEVARHGNFETIFTQPTDHFIPPLVMAKARIGNDMKVLSPKEKQAQQLAEQHNIDSSQELTELKKTNLSKQTDAKIQNEPTLNIKPVSGFLSSSNKPEIDHMTTMIYPTIMSQTNEEINNKGTESSKQKNKTAKTKSKKYDSSKLKKKTLKPYVLPDIQYVHKVIEVTIPSETVKSIPIEITTKIPIASIPTSYETTNGGFGHYVNIGMDSLIQPAGLVDIQPELKYDNNQNSELAVYGMETIKPIANTVNPIANTVNPIANTVNPIENTVNPIANTEEKTNINTITTGYEVDIRESSSKLSGDYSTESPQTRIIITDSPIISITNSISFMSTEPSVVKTGFPSILKPISSVSPQSTSNTDFTTSQKGTIITDNYNVSENPPSIESTEKHFDNITVENQMASSTEVSSTMSTQSPVTVTISNISHHTIKSILNITESPTEEKTTEIYIEDETKDPAINKEHVTEDEHHKQDVTDKTESHKEDVTDDSSSSLEDITLEVDILDMDTNDTEEFHSPLLSESADPIHRPNRKRFPMAHEKKKKFNPLRIIG